MNGEINSDNDLKSVKTAFRILETICDNGEMTLTEVADELSIARSTMHRYLTTLESDEYLVREGNEYRISFRFLRFANHSKIYNPGYPLIERKVDEIADETGELVQFITEQHGHAVYVFQAIGGQGVQVDAYAKTFSHLHSTAGGKAILSTWDTADVKEVIANIELPKLTGDTITNVDDLLAELETIQERGYSINNQENITGLKAISVPVQKPSGTAIGALSVSGPTNRMKGDWFDVELPDLLLGASNELELNLRLL